MSINALANAAAARRPDFFHSTRFLKDYRRSQSRGNVADCRAASTQWRSVSRTSTQIDTALHVLFGYIPTEVLTLYVAVLAAVQRPNEVTSADWIAFWSFLVATPIVVWLVYGAKVKAANKTLPLAVGAWPLWEMLAATVPTVLGVRVANNPV